MSGRLGLAVGSQHYTLGFHNTATLGTIAAAAACARLVNATERQTAVILGIATTQSAGLRAQFGSDVKPLHAGLAAQTAVIATADAGRLSRPAGQRAGQLFIDLLRRSAAAAKLISGWGTPWRIISPGLEFKPYPTCGTHSAADAARALAMSGCKRATAWMH
jgi:2-methylcitrate dehydratase PrpD